MDWLVSSSLVENIFTFHKNVTLVVSCDIGALLSHEMGRWGKSA
jgi:hypothetical protein